MNSVDRNLTLLDQHASMQSHDELSSLKEELLRAKKDAENYRMQNVRLEQQLQDRRDNRETITGTERCAELSDENELLKCNLQSSEYMRTELSQQLGLSEQQRESIRQNYDALVKERERIHEQSLSDGTRLATLQMETDNLRKENQRLVRENTSVKKEFAEQLKRLSTERVSLQKQERERQDFTIQQQKPEERECRNEACRETKMTLQRRAEEIEQKFYAEKCPRPDCEKFRDRLKNIEVQGKGRSPAKDVSNMFGGDYDVVLQDFDELFSDINPDGILGVLESCLDPFEARRLLCEIFQHAYEACKEASLQRIRHTLEALFVVQDKRTRNDDLGDASRVYGLLLHMTGLKEDESVCRDISLQIPTVFSDNESYMKASKELSVKQECLMKVLKVAWKFVTLPSPIIACRPSQYVPKNVDREYGYWVDSTPEAQLIYTRPVVYRCYDGKCAVKGMVANAAVANAVPNADEEIANKGFFTRLVDYVKEVVGGMF